VAKFKYLGKTLTNQNDIHDETKSRLNSENACYHSVQNLGRPRRRVEDNIKIDLKTRCESVDWMHLAQDTVQWRDRLKTVMNFRVPCKMANAFTSWATISFLIRALLHGVRIHFLSLWITKLTIFGLHFGHFSPCPLSFCINSVLHLDTYSDEEQKRGVIFHCFCRNWILQISWVTWQLAFIRRLF
jgi:hypothetical protein